MVTRAQNEDDRLVSVKELAERWGVSALTVHRYMTEYGLPSYKLQPGYTGPRRISITEANEWLAARRQVANG